MKAIKWIKENKIFFVTFGMLMLISFEFLIQKDFTNYVSSYYYPLYVINYNCGFCSRLLIGAVSSLFWDDTLSVLSLIRMLLAVYVFVCLIFSAFINNYLKNSKYNLIWIYTLFMVISPPMTAFLYYLGTLDMFWIAFILASIILVDKKGWRWLVPFLGAICLCIYEIFAITYLPVIAIIILYQFVKKPCASNFIYVAVCAVILGIAAIYFLFIGDSTMKMTSDAMVDFARNRLDAQGTNFDDFYLRSVFFWEAPDVENYHGFIGYIRYNFDVYTKNNLSSSNALVTVTIGNTLVALPFFYLVSKAVKKCEKPLEKFFYLCPYSLFVFMLISLLLSTDVDRFSMHFFLSMIMLLIFFIKEKDHIFSNVYDEVANKLGKNKTILAIIGLSIAKFVLSGVAY